MHLFKSVRKELSAHTLDYLILVSASVVFLLFLRMFRGERTESLLTLLIFTSFYIMWGLVHHTKEKTLHIKNVLEYIIISFVILLLSIVAFSLV